MKQSHGHGRRTFLQLSLATAALPLLPGLSLARGLPDRKLVVILLRGGMDGLAAAPPYADPDYRAMRGALALANREMLPLNDFFALHPSLAGLSELYRQKELVLLHAAATPYRARSHFDAQDLLENGTQQPRGSHSGWLNRAMVLLHGGLDGIAIGGGVPLLLRGTHPVQAWSRSRIPNPDQDFLAKVLELYRGDEMLHDAFARGLQFADKMPDEQRKGKPLQLNVSAAARILRDRSAPDLAVLTLSGWDTHASQGVEKGRLSYSLQQLDGVVRQLKRELAEDWRRTAVLIVTEFGRTVAPNGSGGTDHGTASAAFLAGGLVNGGRVIGHWPGLRSKQLYQGRDLHPANDLRSLCKGLLHELYGLSVADLEREVFPGSAGAGVMRDLLSA